MTTQTHARLNRLTNVMTRVMRAELQGARPAKPVTRQWRWVLAGTIAVSLLAAGFMRFTSASVPTDLSAQPSALRHVSVTTPQRGATAGMTLPATVRPYQAADLYARASGFLKSWHADIGATVKAGQVLAEIDTPDLDQELAQAIALHAQAQAEHDQAVAELDEAKAEIVFAEANVVKAKANVDFAVSVAKRSETLVRTRTVSQQEHEEDVRQRTVRIAEEESAKAELARRKTNLATRQAVIDSRAAVVHNRRANVQRLRDLTGFRHILAPFDGVVARRSAEVGMLVSAGNSSGAPLFSIVQVDVLRVQVAVPQSGALAVKANDRATITIPERPGEPLVGRVTRTAGAVEAASRTLLVELELPNSDGRLLPGVYAQVRFEMSEPAPWVVPAKTIRIRSDGPQVAIVSPDGTVRTQRITLGRDFGATAEVRVGVDGGERLVVNPADDLRDGEKVALSLRER